MAEYDLLVVNGLFVTDKETGQFDVAVKDGKVAKVVPRGSLAAESASKIIDAQGGMIMVTGFGIRQNRYLTDLF
jgi:dihydropyrimidinase